VRGVRRRGLSVCLLRVEGGLGVGCWAWGTRCWAWDLGWDGAGLVGWDGMGWVNGVCCPIMPGMVCAEVTFGPGIRKVDLDGVTGEWSHGQMV
jgi:hypothetical protein